MIRSVLVMVLVLVVMLVVVAGRVDSLPPLPGRRRYTAPTSALIIYTFMSTCRSHVVYYEVEVRSAFLTISAIVFHI